MSDHAADASENKPGDKCGICGGRVAGSSCAHCALVAIGEGDRSSWHADDCGGWPACSGCGWIDRDGAWWAGPCPEAEKPHQAHRSEGSPSPHHWGSVGTSTLMWGSSLDVMASMSVESIDSIVTSPEYADQRDYAHGADTAPDAFAKHLSPFLVEMLRILKPTGSLMLNLGVIMRKGEESPYADEVLATAREMGWKLLHRMVWQKSNPLPLSHPPYLTIAHEWVFWLAPTIKAYRGYDKDTRRPHKASSVARIEQPYIRSTDERYAKRGKTNELHPDGAKPTTVFTCAVGSKRGIQHPAPMAMDLARHLVSLSCPPGGIVLDPFCGSGSTLVAATERGRSSIGIDITEDYLIEAKARLDGHQLALA